MNPDFMFNLKPCELEYDIETYPNFFSCWFYSRSLDRFWYYEISFRRNDTRSLCHFIDRCRDLDSPGVGFNNLGFDYPILHYIYQWSWNESLTPYDIYIKAKTILDSHGPAKFKHTIWDSDQFFKQLDLYKIYHFDNKSKATSLKIMEFNMRMDSIEDLPVPVGTTVNNEQADIIKSYNKHDVIATSMFRERAEGAIAMRRQLTQQLGVNVMNCSDVKIGEKILIHELEKAGVKCYERVDGRKRKRQTQRDIINLKDVVFPYVSFEREEFNSILRYFNSKSIRETKGVFKELNTTVDGLTYHFGTGGLHASVESQTIVSDGRYQLVDVDVKSFYPNLGIKNKLYPAHLGVQFCDAYYGVYLTRSTYEKGTPENEAYKLALNGAYGNSNNEYSVFFDPQYTMSITINGQLLLCMLAEQLIKTPGLRMVQANTDGVTYLCPREYLDHTRAVCRWWEQLTCLELEEQLYKRMFIRDVNSYIAEKEDGSLKRIGAYAHETAEQNPGTRELPYHKDWSARVVPLAAEAALVRGEDIRSFIINHADDYDFYLRTKVPRSSFLEWGGEQVSNIVRYYVSKSGKRLEKVMPPAGPEGAYKRRPGISDTYYNEVLSELIHNQYQDSEFALGVPISEEELIAGLPWDERINTKNRSTYQERRTGVNTGWNVQLCNRLSSLPANWRDDLNYEWYIAETEKLVKPLR